MWVFFGLENVSGFLVCAVFAFLKKGFKAQAPEKQRQSDQSLSSLACRLLSKIHRPIKVNADWSWLVLSLFFFLLLFWFFSSSVRWFGHAPRKDSRWAGRKGGRLQTLEALWGAGQLSPDSEIRSWGFSPHPTLT